MPILSETNIIKIDSQICSINALHSQCSLDIIPIEIEEGEISIDKLIIPYSFYQVNSTNNYIDLSYYLNTNPLNVMTYTCVIPQGNYSAVQFAFILQNLITSNTPILLTITYNRNTNQFNFLITNNYRMTFLFQTGMNSYRSSYVLIGCLQNDYQMLINVLFIPPNQINMNPIRYIDVQLNIVHPNIFESNRYIHRNLSCIPVITNPFNYITEIPINRSMKINHTIISHIEIQLIDNFQQPLNLNGEHFLLLLKIDKKRNVMTFKPNKIKEHIETKEALIHSMDPFVARDRSRAIPLKTKQTLIDIMKLKTKLLKYEIDENNIFDLS